MFTATAKPNEGAPERDRRRPDSRREAAAAERIHALLYRTPAASLMATGTPSNHSLHLETPGGFLVFESRLADKSERYSVKEISSEGVRMRLSGSHAEDLYRTAWLVCAVSSRAEAIIAGSDPRRWRPSRQLQSAAAETITEKIAIAHNGAELTLQMRYRRDQPRNRNLQVASAELECPSLGLPAGHLGEIEGAAARALFIRAHQLLHDRNLALRWSPYRVIQSSAR